MTKKICNDRKGYDKVFHMALSFGLGSVLAGVFSFVPFSPWLAAVLVFVIVVLCGIAWEIYHHIKHGTHICIWDIMWDAVGALAATPVAYFANYYTMWC